MNALFPVVVPVVPGVRVGPGVEIEEIITSRRGDGEDIEQADSEGNCGGCK